MVYLLSNETSNYLSRTRRFSLFQHASYIFSSHHSMTFAQRKNFSQHPQSLFFHTLIARSRNQAPRKNFAWAQSSTPLQTHASASSCRAKWSTVHRLLWARAQHIPTTTIEPRRRYLPTYLPTHYVPISAIHHPIGINHRSQVNVTY